MEHSAEPLRVAANEFQNQVGRYTDMALTRPIMITRHGRDRTVVISAEEYARLKRRDRIAFDPRRLDAENADALRAALEAAPASAEGAVFDAEMDQPAS